MFLTFIKTAWVILRKDLAIWLHQPANIAATVLPPLAFLLVQALGAAAVGRSPVALVVQDTGPQAVHMANIIHQADVFRNQDAHSQPAQALLKNLSVVAVITIPPDFTQHVAAHETAPIDVTVNNLNLDFTNDIRRSVPDAITQYYQAQDSASPIKITLQEQDLRHRDVQFFQYAVLPTIVLLLMISGLVSGGLSAAREWERRTIKELLLSPATNGAIITGKVLAGFVTTRVWRPPADLAVYATPAVLERATRLSRCGTDPAVPVVASGPGAAATLDDKNIEAQAVMVFENFRRNDFAGAYPYARTLIENLTPEKAAGILRTAEFGDPWLYLELAERMEEKDLLYQGVLPHKPKEMCRIRISVAHRCGYCSTVRSNIAKAEGLTEDMIDDLSEYSGSKRFSARNGSGRKRCCSCTATMFLLKTPCVAQDKSPTTSNSMGLPFFSAGHRAHASSDICRIATKSTSPWGRNRSRSCPPRLPAPIRASRTLSLAATAPETPWVFSRAAAPAGVAGSEGLFGHLRESDATRPLLFSVEVRDEAGALLASPLLVGEEGRKLHLDLSQSGGPDNEPVRMSLDLAPHGRGVVDQQLSIRWGLQDVQRAQKRIAGRDHRRELATGNRELSRVDPREQLDAELLRAVLVGGVGDDQAALSELVRNVLLGDRLDLAPRWHTGQVHGLERESGHLYAAARAPGIPTLAA